MKCYKCGGNNFHTAFCDVGQTEQAVNKAMGRFETAKETIDDLGTRLSSAEADRDRYKAALENLVYALDDNLKEEMAVYQFASIHGYKFDGKGYAKEFADAKKIVYQAALSEPEGEQK